MRFPCLSPMARRGSLAGELWSCLSIEYNGKKFDRPGYAKYKESMEQIFYTWLRRTNGRPLSFALHFHHISTGDEASSIAVEGMIKALLSEQHRWEDIAFRCRYYYPTPRFPRVIATNMPELKSLTLSWADRTHDDRQAPDEAQIDISCSPKLRKLRLYGRFNLIIRTAPMMALTEPSCLDFSPEPPTESTVRKCLTFLELAPNLKYFCAHIGDEYSIDEDVIQGVDDLQPLVVLELRVFDLDGGPSPVLLEKLTLPRLWTSELTCSEGGEMFLNFILRSVPPLRYLRLSGDCAREDVLLPALRVLPTLEELDISAATVTKQLFSALVVPPRNPTQGDSDRPSSSSGPGSCLCPALGFFRIDRLEFTGTDETVDIVDAFLHMVTTRWYVFNALTKLTAWSFDKLETIDLPILPGDDYGRRIVRMNLNGGVGVIVHRGSVVHPAYLARLWIWEE